MSAQRTGFFAQQLFLGRLLIARNEPATNACRQNLHRLKPEASTILLMKAITSLVFGWSSRSNRDRPQGSRARKVAHLKARKQKRIFSGPCQAQLELTCIAALMEQRAESIPTSRSAGADYYEGKSALARPRSTGRAFQKEMNVRHKLTKARMQMVFVMVGLPARGKSFISRRLESFLSWKGHTTKVFNVGKYRREAVVATESGKSDFFDPHNSTAKAQREAVALLALEDMLDWLSKEGEIGIFDATNSTEERRQLIIRVCRESGRELGIVFIETLCTNRDVRRGGSCGWRDGGAAWRVLSHEQRYCPCGLALGAQALTSRRFLGLTNLCSSAWPHCLCRLPALCPPRLPHPRICLATSSGARGEHAVQSGWLARLRHHERGGSSCGPARAHREVGRQRVPGAQVRTRTLLQPVVLTLCSPLCWPLPLPAPCTVRLCAPPRVRMGSRRNPLPGTQV